jgi:hypothetical protein
MTSLRDRLLSMVAGQRRIGEKPMPRHLFIGRRD